ncbi:MAG TPA: ferritin family protein [Geobacteraceae bacterium]
MSAKSFSFRISLLLLCIVAAAAVSIPAERSPYPATIAALQTAYDEEIIAHDRCVAFAEKAQEEDFPEIANFFTVIAASEGVHARNYKKLLSRLGAKPKKHEKETVAVSTTSRNLKAATAAEIEQIEKVYPALLEQMKQENHAGAIKAVLRELESEKQHLKLIKQIRAASEDFFGILSRKMEQKPQQYYICQVCGAIAANNPPETCPICKGAGSNYKAVARSPEK